VFWLSDDRLCKEAAFSWDQESLGHQLHDCYIVIRVETTVCHWSLNTNNVSRHKRYGVKLIMTSVYAVYIVILDVKEVQS